jgi:hypothetical protein
MIGLIGIQNDYGSGGNGPTRRDPFQFENNSQETLKSKHLLRNHVLLDLVRG